MNTTEESGFSVLQSDASLIVYFDIKSPYAFVAKDPTYALADELDLWIDWRPLTLDIPSYLGSARLDKKGKVAESTRTPEQWSGVKYAYMDARRYAAAWGYGLRGTEKIWDTRLVHIAFNWVKRHDPQCRGAVRAFLDEAYPRFWQRDLDVESLLVVSELIERSGVALEGFAEWAAGDGGREHDSQQAAIFSAGIYGVPGYVCEQDYFFGREHLPHIRSRLLDSDVAADIGYSLPPLAAMAPISTDQLGDGSASAIKRAPKHAVFAEMQAAAAEGELTIYAAVNPECVQTHLALLKLREIEQRFAGRLRVRYALSSADSLQYNRDESADNQFPPHLSPSLSRGEAHRLFRSRYEAFNLQRYLHRMNVLNNAELTNRVEEITFDDEAERVLNENGISRSFGFVVVDRLGAGHPFKGRQHLDTLLWALSES